MEHVFSNADLIRQVCRIVEDEDSVVRVEEGDALYVGSGLWKWLGKAYIYFCGILGLNVIVRGLGNCLEMGNDKE